MAQTTHRYLRRFDEDSSNNWCENSEYNLLFLRAQENFFNDRLRARGFVFLNEIYEALGLDLSQEGVVVGWARDNPNGDRRIEFDMTIHDDHILIGFNVDGSIWEMLPKEK